MRVCLITPRFPPDVGGVAQASARRFNQLTASLGADSVRVFTPHSWPRHAEEARSAFAQQPWDLIHAYYPSLTGKIAQQLSQWTATPYLLSARGNDIDRDIWKVESRSALLTALAQAALLTGVSRDLTRKLTALVSHVPVQYIPNAVDTERFCPVSAVEKQALRLRWQLSEGVWMGFVGEMRTKKGFSLLLKSFARLHQYSRVPVHLLVVGPIREGPDEALYRFWRQQFPAAAQAVQHFPHVAHDVLHQLYPVLDFLVMPSFQEGMANAALEAMSSGVPVIATDVGGFPDLIDAEESGLLIPAYSENALFKVLDIATHRPELRVLWGEAARRKVMSCFQESHENAAYGLAYQRVLSQV
jgi:L-malate glycosyltransferase